MSIRPKTISSVVMRRACSALLRTHRRVDRQIERAPLPVHVADERDTAPHARGTIVDAIVPNLAPFPTMSQYSAE